MEKDAYKTICDKCYKKTWYETEQQCHYKYFEKEVCSLGYTHQHDNAKEIRCTGTLKVIDYTNIKTYLNIGSRYTFQDSTGKKKRFTLGKTTGWKPCLLLLHNARSTGSSSTLNAGDIIYTIEKGQAVYKINNYYFD